MNKKDIIIVIVQCIILIILIYCLIIRHSDPTFTGITFIAIVQTLHIIFLTLTK